MRVGFEQPNSPTAVNAYVRNDQRFMVLIAIRARVAATQSMPHNVFTAVGIDRWRARTLT